MGRACTIVVVAPFADVDPLPSFERFIDHQFNGAPSLYECLDEQIEQATAQL